MTYNLLNMTTEQIPTLVISSGSLPGMFPFRSFEGHEFFDGGTVLNLNAYSAV